jgi:hypothetical protein
LKNVNIKFDFGISYIFPPNNNEKTHQYLLGDIEIKLFDGIEEILKEFWKNRDKITGTTNDKAYNNRFKRQVELNRLKPYKKYQYKANNIVNELFGKIF